MKKPIVTALAAVALSAGAHAETKFYGKFNVSTAYNDSTEEFNMDSHASRLGIKGSDDLGFATLVYKAEYQHNVDEGGLKARGTYVGLKYDGLGTVKLGRMDTPLKKSQGKFDLFNDIYDIKRNLLGENRDNDSINYTSEKLGNFTVSASAILEEGADGYSVSGVFEKGNIYASVAYDKDVLDSDDVAKLDSVLRATAIVTQGDIRLGAIVNYVEEGNFDDTGFALNAALTKGLHTFKAQFGASEQTINNQGGIDEVQALSIGVDRKLAKTTTVYFYADSEEKNDDDAVNELRIGLVHKF